MHLQCKIAPPSPSFNYILSYPPANFKVKAFHFFQLNLPQGLTNWADSMMMVHLVCLLFVPLAAATALPILPDSLSVNGISGNEQHTVFVLDPQYPLTLSWRFAAPAAYTAVAFKVNLIGGSPGAFSLGSDTWTSGAINATATNIILPASLVKQMQPGERFEWSVSCYDGSSWSPSANASFNTAPDPSIWDKSSWIGGGSELRGELVLPSGTVARAIAYTTGCVPML